MEKDQFEQLGLFYLGRHLEQSEGAGVSEAEPDLLLYPSGDLTTHALCVGMTGSGKTGLCLGLLEEAAIDGVPALVLDPKGDMANLALTFPHMQAEDFLPWMSEEEAANQGISVQELAAQTADTWRQGLAAWGQTPERIRLLKQGADLTVYTPKSRAAEPLSLLNSLAAPAPQVLSDFSTLSNLVSGTAAGLLGLLGIAADPLNSPETILVSNILQAAWLQGQDLSLPQLIKAIIDPPFTAVGVLDLEDFYTQSERKKLAARFNNLLASPGFAGWTQGQPLNIDRLLYNEEGKAKVSVISLAHLTDQERMFFVSLFLNRLLAWTRGQSGSRSLRALFYMDEIFGYFPPVANPPSKQPLLTLLKQARAYGLGIVLTSQNPVDLDYKGLSNIGTWWIGRLQTENDRARLLDGLKTAFDQQGEAFSRQEIDHLIAGLGKRQFLMHNVHEHRISLFETRFCLSYLKGPMSLADLAKLKELGLYDLPQPDIMSEVPEVREPVPPVMPEAPTVSPESAVAPSVPAEDTRDPQQGLPDGVTAYFLPTADTVTSYVPYLAAYTETYFLDKKTLESSTLREFRAVAYEPGPLPIQWSEAAVLDCDIADLTDRGQSGAGFAPLPDAFRDKKNYREWEKALEDYLYRHQSLTRYTCPAYNMQSLEGESLRDFRIRVDQETKEIREQAMTDLRNKYEDKLKRQEEKIRKAEQSLHKKEDMKKDAQRQTMISAGTSVLNALFGRRKLSVGSIGHAATAGKGASRVGRIESDVHRAQDTVETYQEDYQKLVEDMEAAIEALAEQQAAASEDIQEIHLKPLKRDIKSLFLGILWQGRP